MLFKYTSQYNQVMKELKLLLVPPTLKQTCTGCNCVCWKDGIYDVCIPYDTCLKCYNKLYGLDYCQKCIKYTKSAKKNLM